MFVQHTIPKALAKPFAKLLEDQADVFRARRLALVRGREPQLILEVCQGLLSPDTGSFVV